MELRVNEDTSNLSFDLYYCREDVGLDDRGLMMFHGVCLSRLSYVKAFNDKILLTSILEF